MITQVSRIEVKRRIGETVCADDVLESSDSGRLSSGAGGRYKYQRLRERLREAIEKQELNGKLPGERELARRFHANAKTINKALCDLMSEGLLVRHVGRGTFTREKSAANGTARKVCRYLWLAPQGANQAERLYCEAAVVVGDRGHRLEQYAIGGVAPKVDASEFQSSDPHSPSLSKSGEEVPEGVLTPSELRGFDGLVLSGVRPSTQLLADLHRRHLPVVMVNNYHERIRTAMVLPDYSQGIFELCQQMVQRGHKEIALLVASRLQPAATVAEMGYRAAMQRYGLKVRPVMNVGRGVELRGLFEGSDRPNALVCVGADVAESASRGATNGDWEIGVLPEPGERVSLKQPLVYDVSTEAVARWAVELLLSASPGEWPRTVIVPGKLKDLSRG